MDFLLDTNIVVIYGRDNEIAKHIEQKHGIFNGENRLAVSIVTVGEVNALAKKLNLGPSRTSRMQSIIDGMTVSGIHYTELIEAYGDIDRFSSGKIKVEVTKGKFSSRNMGKNDIWIAATAKAFDLTLVTTDKDFMHLHNEIIDVLYIDIEEMKNIKK